MDLQQKIKSQHARLIYSGRKYINKGLKDIEGEMRPWEALDWFEVPAANKSQIKQGLEKLQIHEKTLFPDLGGLAKYLKGWGNIMDRAIGPPAQSSVFHQYFCYVLIPYLSFTFDDRSFLRNTI